MYARCVWLFVVLFGQVVGATAELVLFDGFEYPDGPLQVVSENRWIGHSGTTNQVSVEGGIVKLAASKTQDMNALLNGQPYFASEGADVRLYASFSVKFTALPTSGGSYFAHFKDSAGGFRGRVWALRSGAPTGMFRLGVTSATGSSPVVYDKYLQLDAAYRVVVRLSVADAVTALWVDPLSEDDLHVETNTGSPLPIAAFALRQASGIGTLELDELRVGLSFADVLPGAGPVASGPDDPSVSPEPEPQPDDAPPQEPPTDPEQPPPTDSTAPADPAEPSAPSEPTEPGEPTEPSGSDPTLPPAESNPTDAPTEPAAPDLEPMPDLGPAEPQTTAPSITMQPAAVSVDAGQSARFEVSAAGAEPLGYQWTFNGLEIPGATNTVLEIVESTREQEGDYRVRVTNEFGTATSVAAELIVTLPPAIPTPVELSLALTSTGDPIVVWAAHSDRDYSVLAATDLSGPFVPLVNGLRFADGRGAFIDTGAARGGIRFYRISSP